MTDRDWRSENGQGGGDSRVFGDAEPSEEPAYAGTDLRHAYLVVRRRWWLPALLGVALAGLAFAWQRQRVLTYTASAVVKKNQPASPLSADLRPAVANRLAIQDVNTQIRILKSRVVLGPVVDTLALQLSLDDPGQVRRSAVFDGAVLDHPVPGHHYRIVRSASGFELRDLDSNAVVSRAPVGGFLAGRGFRVRPDTSVALGAPVDFRVVPHARAVSTLEGHLSVAGVEDTPLINVSYRTTDPVLAAAVVNQVAQSYQRQSASASREQATRRRVFTGQQLTAMGDSLQVAQDAVRAYQQRTGALDPTAEGSTLLQAKITADQNLQTLQYNESLLQKLIKSLESGSGEDDALRRMLVLGQNLVPGVQSEYENLQALRAQRSKLTAGSYGYTSNAAQVQAVDSLITASKHEMVDLAVQSLAAIKQRIADARSTLDNLTTRISAVPTRTTELTRLQQHAQELLHTYNLLATNYYQALIDEAVVAGDVDIIDPATVPTRADPNYARRSALVGLLLGLTLGIVLAFFIDGLDVRIKSVEDVEGAGGVGVLATVPHFHRQEAGGPDRRGASVHAGEEAFRTLRTMLRFARADERRVIAVASSGPGEGKTTVVSNLGVALAREGSRVLVVDTDLRRPRLHQHMGGEPSPGLSDVLIGATPLEEAVQDAPAAPGLSLLAAGSPTSAPAELVGSEAFGDLVQTLKGQYDYVLFDTPPVLPVADALVISRNTDGTLLIARLLETELPALRRALTQLGQVGAEILGVVLNDMRAGRGYGYGYGTRYGDGAYVSSSVNRGADASGALPPKRRLRRSGAGRRGE